MKFLSPQSPVTLHDLAAFRAFLWVDVPDSLDEFSPRISSESASLRLHLLRIGIRLFLGLEVSGCISVMSGISASGTLTKFQMLSWARHVLCQHGKELGGVPFLVATSFGAAFHFARLFVIRELAIANRGAEKVANKAS